MLEAEEVAAIREAMGQVANAPASAALPSKDATPVELIAEDRAAVQARPNGLKLASRWARAIKKHLVRLSGLKLDVDVLGAESVDSASLRDEMTASWTSCIAAADRPGAVLVAISGSMIETMAARLLGAPKEDGAPSDRLPSPVALRLFQPVGDTLLRALCEALHDEQGSKATILDDAKTMRTRLELTTTGMALLVTLAVRGGATGQIRLVARPETLIAPEPRVEAVAASAALIQEVLGEIPAEICVELGQARMKMSELGALKPGDVITLDRFVDDLLPVKVQGVVKGFGRAMVARNTMAVEISARKESEAA